MPAFNTEVKHQLGKEEATRRLKGFLEQVRERYKDQVSDLQGSWTDNVLNFMLKTYGFNISGILTVQDDVVHLTGQLPLAAMAFRGKIEQSISNELERELKA